MNENTIELISGTGFFVVYFGLALFLGGWILSLLLAKPYKKSVRDAGILNISTTILTGVLIYGMASLPQRYMMDFRLSLGIILLATAVIYSVSLVLLNKGLKFLKSGWVACIMVLFNLISFIVPALVLSLLMPGLGASM